MAEINPRTAQHDSQLEAILDSILVDMTAVRTVLGGILTGSATYDAASLTDGTGATTTVTVTGAALGDFVIISHGVDLAGITVTGYVSAADTVSVRFQNESGGTLDLASSTLRALVLPRATFAAPAALTTTT
jgi:hypothetical protein